MKRSMTLKKPVRCASDGTALFIRVAPDGTCRAGAEDLFVEEEEGAVVAAAIINQTQVPEYALCPWEYPAQENEVMVLHTLVVDPRCSGRGYGTAFVAFYEEYAGAHGCAYLRMDTQEMNRGARAAVCRLGLSGAGHCALRVQRDSRCTAGMPGKETGPGNAGA